MDSHLHGSDERRVGGCKGNNECDVELAKALSKNDGLADKILATNTNVYGQILKHHIPQEKIIKPLWLVENTYKEGIMIRHVLSKENSSSALVVSDAYHLYRVKWIFKDTLSGDSPHLSFIPSDLPELHLFWWNNSESRALVLWEIPKIVYYWIWHGMLGFEDNPAWLIKMKKLF